MKNFPSPHVHVNSLDSASTPEDFVARELELGTGYITVTDHGSLGACRTVYDLGKKAGLTPVIGLEAYLRDETCSILSANGYTKNANGAFVDAPKYCHITMHAQDQVAYECMVRLLSRADERLDDHLKLLEAKDRRHGNERKPLFNWADLEELGSHNVTMTSGCLIGVIGRHMLDNDDVKTSIAYFKKLKAIVKPGNLYAEVFPHDCSHNWIEGVFLKMADGTKQVFYAGKTLMTDAGEVSASNLAKQWASGKHSTLKSVKDRSKWREMAEVQIVGVEQKEGFERNDCRLGREDGDIQAAINQKMIELATWMKVPVIVSDDAHYSTSEAQVVQNVRLAQSGSWRFFDDYSRTDSQTAFAHFQKTLGTSQDQFEKWVDNGYEWASKFKDFKFETPPSLPTKFYEVEYEKATWFKAGDRDNSFRYTMDLIRKHGRMDWKNKVYVDRLKTELDLLHNNGVIDLLPYWFIDEEVVGVYEDAKTLTGVGRGSAAGVLLTYLLGITHVDPLRYGLSLERFITLDRIKSLRMPDIDQDLPHRELLVDPDDPTAGWLHKRFGDHVAQMSVEVKLKLKMAVRDVSRMRRHHVPPDIEIMSKKFLLPPMGVDDYDFVMGWDTDEGHNQGSVEYDPTLKEYVRKYPEDWEIVQQCLGLGRHKSKHPCAWIIANKPVHEFIPMTTISDARVTAYTAKSVEAVGGLKMDFLVVNSLLDIDNALKLIQARSGKEFVDQVVGGKKVPGFRLVPFKDDVFDIWDLPEDQDVFGDIAQGKTETVFQLNTPGAMQWLRHFAHKKENGNYLINSISTVAAFTALDRKGPLDVAIENPDDGSTHNMLVEYARRARGLTGSPDVLPVFEQLLPDTYGILVFQEQLQKLYQHLTGCSLTEAEKFRTLISKKEVQEIEKYYTPFIEAATPKIGADGAKAAFQQMQKWSGYGFNASHSFCYAITGYACAFLKHHYPLEWWTAVLGNAAKNEVSEKFWAYCGNIIDLPDVKLSGQKFEIQNERIRAPLSLLKGVGDGAHKQIMEMKGLDPLCDGHKPAQGLRTCDYEDALDFCRKIEKHRLATGTWTTKTVKYKDKNDRYQDPETGKLKSKDKTREQPHFSKGSSALNRKVIQTLILSGSMDSLFPKDTPVGEQMSLYEAALAQAETETEVELSKKTGKPPKTVKPEKVDSAQWDVGPLKRYMMRKSVLPIYGADLIPAVRAVERSVGRDLDGDVVMRWRSPRENKVIELPLIDAKTLAEIDATDQEIRVAVAAYVDDAEVRNYGEDRDREMLKLFVDIEGSRFEYVKWAGKDIKLQPRFKVPLKGAVVLVVLNRWGDRKSFSVDDVLVVEPPLDHKEPEKGPEIETSDGGTAEDATASAI